MSANRVVLYFDKQQDALFHSGRQFGYVGGRTGRKAMPSSRVAEEICKASRITAEGF
jgi:hypothetical protein